MKKITIITGATASGKTAYSLNYAKNFEKAIIINADASAVYKNFPILTAQPSLSEKNLYPHFLFEITEITENFSVGKWLAEVEKILNNPEFEDSKKIIVGGTCMYIFLLIKGLYEIPEIKPEVRNFAKLTFEKIGYEALLNEVLKFDPETNKDTQRLLNNYSLFQQTGKSFSDFQKSPKKMFLKEGEFELIKINPAREIIYENCNKRFEKMVKLGAISEVENAIATYGVDFETNKIIGYGEIKNFLMGAETLEQAILKASQKTRNLAKGQITWLKNKL
jgi:tRNA dimethylallyltransferase